MSKGPPRRTQGLRRLSRTSTEVREGGESQPRPHTFLGHKVLSDQEFAEGPGQGARVGEWGQAGGCLGR